MLENPKKDVRRTLTCHGHRPNGAFFPPTILVSGRAIVGIPHSTFRAAEIVTEFGWTDPISFELFKLKMDGGAGGAGVVDGGGGGVVVVVVVVLVVVVVEVDDDVELDVYCDGLMGFRVPS